MKVTYTTTHRERIERRLRHTIISRLVTENPNLAAALNNNSAALRDATRRAVEDLLLDFKVTPRP